MTIHDWATKAAEGFDYESRLDRFFQAFYACIVITPATPDEQWRGIDRWFRQCGYDGDDREHGLATTIEYKADARAFTTGNAFVETVSNDQTGRKGWALTTEADSIAYYLPDGELIYILSPLVIRQQLARWRREYPMVAARNEGYSTLGLLVPLHEFERYASEVINMADYEAR